MKSMIAISIFNQKADGLETMEIKNDEQHVSYYDYSITKTHYVPTLNEL